MDESLSSGDQLFSALADGRFDDLWTLAAEEPPGEEVSLSAALRVETPYPASWAAWALSDFDLVFRWALRSAGTGIPVSVLVAERAEPAASHQGLKLVEVAPGSWLSKLDPTDDLEKVFESKHWRVFAAMLVAFGVVDWGVRNVVMGDDAGATPTYESQIVDDTEIHPVVSGVNGNVTITIDTTRYDVRCGPSNLWLPRREAGQFGHH
jgi:hypothetical protein